MASPAFVLFAGEPGWRIGVVSSSGRTFVSLQINPEENPQQIAAHVAEAMKDAGYGGQGVVLAVPSAWCLAASIHTGDLPKSDRKAMLYRLEEKLPLAAESIIADFVSRDDIAHAAADSTSLGVCVKQQMVEPLVEALEAAGIAVQSITPAVLLATQALASDESTLLLCGDDSRSAAQVDIISLESARPTSWALVPPSLADVKLQLDLLTMSAKSSPRIEAVDVDPVLVSSLVETTSQLVSVREEGISNAVAQMGGEIAAGRQRPWVDFRRGPLAIRDPLRQHRKALNALLAAMAALLLACTVGMLIRAERYRRSEQSSQNQMIDAFRAQFPGWTIPPNVKAVVESEHRKTATTAAGAVPAEARASALQTLHDVLSKLPTEGRYAIDHMTFEDASFELQGRLRSYEQVDAIASAARQAGLDVPPPQARKVSEGLWSFTLRGARPGKAAAVAKNVSD
jgi:hypothetical protein